MTSSSHFWYCSRSNSSSFIFCPIELKFDTGFNIEALISNSSQKIRYNYVLKEKNAIFLRKTDDLPKRSVTKVLPWLLLLLLTENYFKCCLI